MTPPNSQQSSDMPKPPREKIIEWAARSRHQPNPSAYMRQCYLNYGAEQMLAACAAWLEKQTGYAVLTKEMQQELGCSHD